MCELVWRSLDSNDENVVAADADDYKSDYRFIHKSGRQSQTRRHYPAFYLQPVVGNHSSLNRNRKEISLNTDSMATWTLVERWLSQCVQGHSRCNESHSRTVARLPARLIEISETTDQLRLISSNTTELRGPYVTLSHCWGSGQYLKLATSTIDRLKNRFNLILLPQTFRDAVRVTRKLGVDTSGLMHFAYCRTHRLTGTKRLVQWQISIKEPTATLRQLVQLMAMVDFFTTAMSIWSSAVQSKLGGRIARLRN